MKYGLSTLQVFKTLIFGVTLLLATTSSTEAFSGAGAGTSEDPYLITTCEQFMEIESDLWGSYKLTTSLDCSALGNDIIIEGGRFNFSGELDGNGKTIVINLNSSNDTGLFALIESAKIHSLHIDGSVTGVDNVGALIGTSYSSSALISHVKSTVNVIGNSRVGGIAGNYTGTISNSFSSGTVTAVSNTGGLVGRMSTGDISTSYFSGLVTGEDNIGGIVGHLTQRFSLNDNVVTGRIQTIDSTVGALFATTSFIYQQEMDNNFFDITTTEQTDCYVSTLPDGVECIGVNGDGSEPNYFKGNSTNAPFDTWTFDNDNWVVVPHDYPELAMFYTPPVDNNEDNDSDTPISTPKPHRRSSKPPSCSESEPVGTPDLFQIDRTGSTATLYFTPVPGAKSYHVVFGYENGDARFGGLSLPITTDMNTGVQKIEINHLDPKIPYWFTVLAANGCASGNWSDWLKADRITQRQSVFYKY